MFRSVVLSRPSHLIHCSPPELWWYCILNLFYYHFDRPNNELFISKLEQVQYNAALAITGAIKCTLHSKPYKGLGPESLKSRRGLRRLCVLHKIISNELPTYLYKFIPKKSHQYITRNVNDIANYQCRIDLFKLSFFPWTITEWNEIDIKIRNSP